MKSYVNQLKTIIFDIETLGLMPSRNMIISASFCDPNTGDVFQLFTDENNSEEKVIKDIYQQLDKYNAVVTYNGDRFDLPFVKTRAAKYGIKHIEKFWSIDLYRLLKAYWPQAKRMPHLNQKSVEYALGLSESREDKIGGAECISLYQKYLDGDFNAKDIILLHNADDVRQLARIYNKANFLPEDQIAFERGFALKSEEFIKIKGIRIENNFLFAEARTEARGIPSSIYDDEYEFEYDCFTGEINIKLILQNKEDLKFVDLNKLPVNSKDFADLQGYHSDFLVLQNKDGILYKEVNTLISILLLKGNLF